MGNGIRTAIRNQFYCIVGISGMNIEMIAMQQAMVIFKIELWKLLINC
jgi:hypothetical protein